MQTRNKTAVSAMHSPKRVHGLLLTTLLSLLITLGCQKDDTPSSRNADLRLLVDSLVSPVALLEAPDGSRRLFVADQVGQVWIIDPGGQRLSEPFIDVSSKIVELRLGYDERGL
ncbi:MAG TPA: hypothetical protein VD794_01665, partial [Flavisolibacter sp.]|nr:hypothetical protein [Flavisolibacter sp.]